MTKQIDVATLSDEELTDLFSEAFEEQVASYNNIQQFECTCTRVPAQANAKIEVMIIGLAGSPSVDQFKAMENLKNVDSVVISREDKGSLKFTILPKETISLNTNDYIIVYQSA